MVSSESHICQGQDLLKPEFVFLYNSRLSLEAFIGLLLWCCRLEK